MQFNSLEFLLFFPAVVLLYFILPKKARRYWLLAASLFFYMCWNPAYILLLLFCIGVTFLSGLLLGKIQNSESRKQLLQKRTVLAVCVILNLALLVFFKYFNFFSDVLGGILALFRISIVTPKIDVLLPVGISFFTLQALGYTIDVYQGKVEPERNFFQYALFVSFFPQLVAGPIERYENLMPQLREPKQFDDTCVRRGLLTMLWGLFLKMVIADRSALYVNEIYANWTAYHGIQLIAANILFAVQIYCDFMGYSMIAKGAAQVLGIDLMDNFDTPYLAGSVRDFWRRWHISLSGWLRDYLYIPLGGNRKGKWRKRLNLLLTFLVSGLWHGANLTFLAWGLLHGVYQVLEDILLPHMKTLAGKIGVRRGNRGIRFLRTAITFLLIDAAWVVFRAEDLPSAVGILMNSLRFQDMSGQAAGLLATFGNWKVYAPLLIGLVLLIAAGLLKNSGKQLLQVVDRRTPVTRLLFYWCLVILILFSTNVGGQEFIYFRF